MCAEFSGHGNSAAEEENGVERIECEWENWMTGERVVESRCNQVEK
jgi:hypothetical protein